MTFQNKIHKDHLLILLIWVTVTLINIQKPFHIDDTFHLQAAQHIEENPLTPMSGQVLWENAPKEIKEFNQPPLFFYLMAATIHILGTSLIGLHLLVAFFSLVALIFFYKICRFVQFKQAIIPLALFGLSPAFIVNQNVMVDIPLVSLILGSTYYYLKAQRFNKKWYYLISGLFLGAALLTKYSALPLLFAFLISGLARQRLSSLLSVIIPLVLLSLWSYWNYIEYQDIHILNRNTQKIDLFSLVSFTACLGSISFYFPILLSFLNSKWSRIITISFTVILLSIGMGVLSANITETLSNQILNILFIILGLFIIGISLFSTINKKLRPKDWVQSETFFFFLCAAGLFLFLAFFAPFPATRHLLLTIPFILLINKNLFPEKINFNLKSAIALTLFFGISLGVSDWHYANYYRIQAKRMAEKIEGKKWSNGYWAWQWYSKKAGMDWYHWGVLTIHKGDFIITPATVPGQYIIPEEINLDTLERLTKPFNPFTFISTKDARFYTSSYNKPSWNFSKAPTDTILILKVIDGFDVFDMVNRIKKQKPWLENIKKSAQEKGISVDSALFLNAQWVIENTKSSN